MLRKMYWGGGGGKKSTTSDTDEETGKHVCHGGVQALPRSKAAL